MTLIILFNLLVFLLLRVLIKKNIFIKTLGFIFISLQALIIIITPFRNRATSLTRDLPLEFFLTSFFLISSSLVFFSIIVFWVLPEEKKKQLQELEIKTDGFISDLLLEIRMYCCEKFSFYFKIEDFLSKKITSFVVLLLFGNKDILFCLFLIFPWIGWIVAFNIDLYKGSFNLSVYLFAYFFFSSRIFSFFLFTAKTTLWANFNTLYLNNCKKLYFITISNIDRLFFSFQFLVDLIFKPEQCSLSFSGKTDLVNFWKKLNLMIYFFCLHYSLETYWKFNLPRAKSFFYWLNFYGVSCSIVFYYLPSVFGLLFFWVSIFLVLYHYFSLFITNARDEEFSLFIKNLPGNIGWYQNELIIKKHFTVLEAYDGLLDQTYCTLPTTKFKSKDFIDLFGLLFFSLMLFSLFAYFDSKEFLELVRWYFKLLHQVIN